MDVTPEHKLKRYLHYASEDGVYTPGDRHALKYYTPSKFTCTTELFQELKGRYILTTIQEVVDNKSYLYIDAILFALAHCITRPEVTPAFRCSAYDVAEKIITKAEHLLTFCGFLTKLSSSKGYCGRGVRRLIHKWYLSKTALELAEIVTTTPKWRGWRHKDLLKLSHIRSNEPDKNAVIMFILKGLEEVRNKFSEIPKVEPIISYLSTVDSFRKSADSESVARLIESYSLTIKHVNSVVIHNREVWKALLLQISLNDLLDNFPILTKNKLFRNGHSWDDEFVRCVCDAMGNPSSVAESKLHPNRVFVELYKYKCLATVKLNFAKKARPALSTKSLIPPQICPDIISSLLKLLKASFKNLTPTKKRFLVLIDGGDYMKSTQCGYSRYISPVLAASIILLTLLKIEKRVEVYTCSPSGLLLLEPYTVPAVPDIESLVTSLQKIDKTRMDFRKMIKWAIKNKKEFDAFIMLGSYVKIPSVDIIHQSLTAYSEATKVQDSKLIVCSLRGMPFKYTCPEHPRVLSINGFDDKICRLIESFVKGSF